MAGSIDFTKLMNDFNMWLNDLPNKLNNLIEKIRNYPPDKQGAVAAIGIGSFMVLISIILFIL
jgi:hypothetical protein